MKAEPGHMARTWAALQDVAPGLGQYPEYTPEERDNVGAAVVTELARRLKAAEAKLAALE